MDFKQLANQGWTNISRSSSCSHLIWNYFSPAKFYESVIFPIEDLIEDIKLDLETSYNGSASVTYNVSNFSNICGQSIYKDTEYYFNGRCFSLMMPQCLLDKGILEINVNFKEKGKQRHRSILTSNNPHLVSVDIFIHHTGQYFSPDSRARVDISPGYYKKIAVNHEVEKTTSVTFVAVKYSTLCLFLSCLNLCWFVLISGEDNSICLN